MSIINFRDNEEDYGQFLFISPESEEYTYPIVNFNRDKYYVYQFNTTPENIQCNTHYNNNNIPTLYLTACISITILYTSNCLYNLWSTEQ